MFAAKYTFKTTAGLHPCRANEALEDSAAYFSKLDALITSNKETIVAVGETGSWRTLSY